MNRNAQTKPKLLIVDDEAPIRSLLGEFMSGEGFDVRLAASAGEALTLLEQEPFALVLSDVRMPGMSGLDLLSVVVRKHPTVGMMMLTACEDLSLAVAAMRTGALDYVIKPFKLHEIAASVRDALGRKWQQLEQVRRIEVLEQSVNAHAHELRHVLEKLDDASETTLEALVSALDAREHETLAHSKRVSEYSLRLAREMGVEGPLLDVIRRGAMLHDVGKIGISDAILLKPGKLSAEEWQEMRRHPEIGCWILRGIESLRPACDIVLSHHERFDGKGYPNELRGDQIPLGARIFAVMDALDVMTSDRPYRKAQSYESARAEIRALSGVQFDPEVVRHFLRVPVQVWEQIRAQTTTVSSEAAVRLASGL